MRRTVVPCIRQPAHTPASKPSQDNVRALPFIRSRPSSDMSRPGMCLVSLDLALFSRHTLQSLPTFPTLAGNITCKNRMRTASSLSMCHCTVLRFLWTLIRLQCRRTTSWCALPPQAEPRLSYADLRAVPFSCPHAKYTVNVLTPCAAYEHCNVLGSPCIHSDGTARNTARVVGIRTSGGRTVRELIGTHGTHHFINVTHAPPPPPVPAHAWYEQAR
jgi:hypothetical protein